MKYRGCGILNHITSLPSPYGVGDLGPWAYRFADFLHRAGQTYWQILPLTPTSSFQGNSPYSSSSAFAGNPLVISPDILVGKNLAQASDMEDRFPTVQERADYEGASALRSELFEKAYERFKQAGQHFAYEQFCADEYYWLEDYSLFSVLKKHYGGRAWHKWPKHVRDRSPDALAAAKAQFVNELEKVKFVQFMFHEQWQELKKYCRENNIHIIGDLTIYVSHDSADVWAHREIFKLNGKREPAFLSGVAPDEFNPAGQFWGHPVYRWDILENSGFAWWIARMEKSLRLYDLVRLDHFQGFFRYWEIPAAGKSADRGHWANAPSEAFFASLSRHFPILPIIAEDLGRITAEIRENMIRYDIPGMRPLLFAFNKSLPANPCAPHNIKNNTVVYTGTHDLNTVKGWFEEASPEERKRFFRYLGRRVKADAAARAMIDMAMMTVADTVILPMQDILNLGSESRMNRPGTARGNWLWRFRASDITPALTKRLGAAAAFFGRRPNPVYS